MSKHYTYKTKFGFPHLIQWEEQGTKFSVNGWYQLCRKVSGVRNKLGGDLKPGWEDRLATDLCRKYSFDGCCEKSPVVRSIKLDDIRSFYASMKHWKALNGKLVSQAQAEARASVCASCELNVTITGCFGCANVLPSILKLMKGASTSKDAELKGCGVCGCVNKALVHLPLEVKRHNGSTIEELPDHCWQKIEFKEMS
jgi:hypothetical protein